MNNSLFEKLKYFRFVWVFKYYLKLAFICNVLFSIICIIIF